MSVCQNRICSGENMSLRPGETLAAAGRYFVGERNEERKGKARGMGGRAGKSAGRRLRNVRAGFGRYRESAMIGSVESRSESRALKQRWLCGVDEGEIGDLRLESNARHD